MAKVPSTTRIRRMELFLVQFHPFVDYILSALRQQIEAFHTLHQAVTLQWYPAPMRSP